MMRNEGCDRRRFERIETRRLIKMFDVDKHEFYGVILNISQKGLKITSKTVLLPHSYCEFEFKLNSNRNITGVGQVVYAIPKSPLLKKTSYYYGIRFLDIDFDNLREISNFIQQTKYLEATIYSRLSKNNLSYMSQL